MEHERIALSYSNDENLSVVHALLAVRDSVDELARAVRALAPQEPTTKSS